jgi:hypothetical protein
MRFSLKRMGAMLCIVLAMAFAAVSATNAVNKIQHQQGGAAHHEHLQFSDILVDADDHHDDHDNANDREENSAANHQPGAGHHHHGDMTPGLPALASGETAMPGLGADRHSLKPDGGVLGHPTRGPERPPKGIAIYS